MSVTTNANVIVNASVAANATAACKPHIEVLGSKVDLLSLDDAVCQIEEWIRSRERFHRVVVTGFHGLWESYRDRELHHALNSADLWIADGIAPVFVARMRGMRHARRIPGTELLEAFLAKADFGGYSSFFYGDTEETLARLKERVEAKYPGHRVVGTLSPPFREISPEEDEEHVRRINEAQADVLWVGLGTPRQDRWIYEHRDRLDVPVAVAVGAAFRFLSGRVRRAPDWVGRAGFEWAFRLAMEPKKCWRRCLIQGPLFLGHLVVDLFRNGEAR